VFLQFKIQFLLGNSPLRFLSLNHNNTPSYLPVRRFKIKRRLEGKNLRPASDRLPAEILGINPNVLPFPPPY
jgi:hypothetical protein